MRSLRGIIGMAGSWWLTALLAAALSGVYLALSFGRNPYPAWVAFVFHAPAGIAIILGLIVNFLAASVRIAVARFRRPPLTREYFRSLDIHRAVPARGGEALRVSAELTGMQAVSPAAAERGMRRVTGKWSFLPGLLFRAGLTLTLISLLLTAHFRRIADATLTEGGSATLLGAAVTLDSISADLPSDFLQVGDEGTLLLEGVSARIGVDGEEDMVTPGFPTRIRGRWFRIRHLGYAQSLTVGLRGSRSDLTAILDILPPGKHSIVSLPSGKAFLTFALDPDRTITKGLLTGRQYNLARPAYLVRVQEGRPRERVEGKRMRAGEQATVGPAKVSLGSQRLSVRLQAVSDPGLLPLYAGVITLLAGLFAMAGRFFWYEREIALLQDGEQLLIGSRDEFYKKWGVARFQRWEEKLAARTLP